jgi:hypothetical protein
MSVPPRAPGWYRDPADRSRMRHWSGAYWDVPSRRVPPWMAGTAAVITAPARSGQRAGGPRLDGPAHPAMLPANVKSAAQGRVTRRVPVPVATASTLGGPAGPGGAPTLIEPRVPIGRRRWPGSAPLIVGGTLVLAILLAVAGMVAVSKSPITATQVSADPVFIRSANRACTQAMGAIRLPTRAAIGDAADRGAATGGGAPVPVPSPAVTATANRALRALVAKLQSLRSAGALGTQLVGWFDDLDRYAADRTVAAGRAAGAGSGAVAVAGHPSPEATASAAAKKALSAAGVAANQADSFALGNSLGECVLVSPPSGTSPSTEAPASPQRPGA